MKNKFLQFALSALAAFALWLYVISVVSPESTETFYDIPVSYQNDILEERGLMIVSEKPTVNLELQGNRSDLNELNANNITILVDLSDIKTPGTQMLQYDVSFPANLPNNAFKTLSQTPNLLQLKVENKIKKQLPILLDFGDTKVPEGFVADKENPVMDTLTVEVSGPQSSVEKLDHATIQVDLTDKTESVVGAFQYVLCDAEGNPVDAQMVTTNVEEVNLSIKIQALKEVALLVNVEEGGGATNGTYKLEQTVGSIWIAGNEARLKDMEAIELGTIDLAELKGETNDITYDIVLPEGVTNMSGVTTCTVTISFPDLANKKMTISKDKIVAVGIPEGAEVVWITEFVELELRGHKDLIKKLTDKDVTVTVDFTDEELGSVSKVPRITLSEEFADVGAISVSSVMATLQTGAQEPDATEG